MVLFDQLIENPLKWQNVPDVIKRTCYSLIEQINRLPVGFSEVDEALTAVKQDVVKRDLDFRELAHSVEFLRGSFQDFTKRYNADREFMQNFVNETEERSKRQYRELKHSTKKLKSSLSTRIQQVDRLASSRINQIKAEITTLKEHVTDVMKRELNVFTTNLEHLRIDVSGLDRRLNLLEQQFYEHREITSNTIRNKVSLSDLEALRKKMTDTEAKFMEHTTMISTEIRDNMDFMIKRAEDEILHNVQGRVDAEMKSNSENLKSVQERHSKRVENELDRMDRMLKLKFSALNQYVDREFQDKEKFILSIRDTTEQTCKQLTVAVNSFSSQIQEYQVNIEYIQKEGWKRCELDQKSLRHEVDMLYSRVLEVRDHLPRVATNITEARIHALEARVRESEAQRIMEIPEPPSISIPPLHHLPSFPSAPNDSSTSNSGNITHRRPLSSARTFRPLSARSQSSNLVSDAVDCVPFKPLSARSRSVSGFV